MENPLITAVTHTTDEALITLTGVPDRPGAVAEIFTALAGGGVNVDTIVQNKPAGQDVRAEVSFTLSSEDMHAAEVALAPVKEHLELTGIELDEEVGKVSIIGAGMRSHPGVAAKVFEVMGTEGINIEIIHTSPIKITCLIRQAGVPAAVIALHEAFGLSAAEVQEELPLGQQAR